jgi:VWFA-related protein
MKPVSALAAGGVLCLSALIGATQDPGQTPVFRAGVELIQIDASVLDARRRPVRGLTSADFTVFVDGRPRPVVAFRPVDLPPPPPAPAAAWMRDIAPDVVTNARPTGRVVAILIDDGSFNDAGAVELPAVRKAREVARRAVDELGPQDLAAVLFTEHGRSAQNFTASRELLLRAIDDASLMPSPGVSLGERATCLCGTCSITAIARIAEVLQSLPQERKTILYLSAGLPIQAAIAPPRNPIGASALVNASHCNAMQQRAMNDAIRRASLANVTVQAVDVRGVLGAGIDLQIGFLRAMSEDTGGRAVVRNNDMEREVPALFAETGSYYLLGVEAPADRDDGRLHAIRVEVDRPNVEVRTRRGYYAPTVQERRRLAALESRGVDTAIAGVLPRTDVPLDVSVFPIADAAGRGSSALGVVIGITPPNTSRGAAPSETARAVVTAFHPETGASVGSHDQRLSISRNATQNDTGRYEVLSRLDVRPGRYEIRVAVERGDGRTGSVYTYADVPDFRDGDVALSGLVLSVEPAARVAPLTALRDLLPVVPTARRSFGAAERVAAWLRIHRPAGTTATVTMRITNTHNDVVADRTDDIAFVDGRRRTATDHRVDLPIESLPPGEYLLTVEVEAGDARARRDVRFSIQ